MSTSLLYERVDRLVLSKTSKVPLIPEVEEAKQQKYFATRLKQLMRTEDVKERGSRLKFICDWFIAKEGIQSIPYEFISDTPLVPTVLSLLANRVLAEEEHMLNAIRILEYASAEDEPNDCFYSNDFFELLIWYILNTESADITQHCLISIAQILAKFNPGLTWDIAQLGAVLSQKGIVSDKIEVVAISAYLLMLMCAVSGDRESLLEVVMARWSVETGPDFIITKFVLRGLRTAIMHSPEFMELAATKIIGVCVEVCPRGPDVMIESVRCLTCMAMGGHFDKVLETPIIEMISAVNIVSPMNEDIDLFQACSMLASVYLKNESGRCKLVSEHMIEKYCEVAQNSTFEMRALSLSLLGSSITAGNEQLLEISMRCGIFQSAVEVLDSSEELLQEWLQMLCVILTMYPQAIPAALEAGISSSLENYMSEDSLEIAELAEGLLALMERAV